MTAEDDALAEAKERADSFFHFVLRSRLPIISNVDKRDKFVPWPRDHAATSVSVHGRDCSRDYAWFMIFNFVNDGTVDIQTEESVRVVKRFVNPTNEELFDFIKRKNEHALRTVRVAQLLAAENEDDVLSKHEEDKIVGAGGMSFALRLEEAADPNDLTVIGIFFGRRPERGYGSLPAPAANEKQVVTRFMRNIGGNELASVRRYFVDKTAPAFLPFIKRRLLHEKEALSRLFDEVVNRLKTGDFDVRVLGRPDRTLLFRAEIKSWRRFFESSK